MLPIASFLIATVIATQPANPKVIAASFAGSGCPAQNQAETTLDGAKLLLALPELVAKAGPGVPKSALRANCSLVVTLDHGPGFMVAPEAATILANGTLAGSQAKISLRAHLQGQQPTAAAEASVKGDVRMQQLRLEPKKNFSKCEKTATLVLNFSIFLELKPGVTASEHMAATPLVTTLAWQPCESMPAE